jgi:hypothetical protein
LCPSRRAPLRNPSARRSAEYGWRFAKDEERKVPHDRDSVFSQSDEQKEAEIERRAQERVARAIEDIPEIMTHAVEHALHRSATVNAQAIATELRKLAADNELMEQVATHFQKHVLRSWKEWLGGKVWNFILTVTFGALLAWLSFKQFFGNGEKT